MFIYFCIFILVLITSLIAEKNEHNRKIFILFAGISILIPSVFAGSRASGIGTDTKVYIDVIFKSCIRANSLSDVLNIANDSGTEPFYWFINYLVSLFSNNLSAIYFVLEFIFIIFSFLGCRNIAKKLNINYSFCYFILLILFYNKSLNMCRQSIAMSICLFSITFIFEKKLLRFIICMFVGFLFHKSIVLFVPLYFINNIINSQHKFKVFIEMVIILAVLLLITIYKPVVIELVNLKILSCKYLNYIFKFGDSYNIKFIEVIFQLFLLFIGVIFSKSFEKKSKYNDFFVFLSVLAFATFLVGFNAKYAQRISYYYSFCLIFLIAQIPYLFKAIKEKIIVSFCLSVLLLFYGKLYYEKYNFDQTVPYKIEVNKNIYK